MGFALTIVSWNIANAQPSAAADCPSLRSQELPRLLTDEILRSHFFNSPNQQASSQSQPYRHPDVIALQESPSPSWATNVFTQFGFTSIGTQMSHSGYCDLLVSAELAQQASPLLGMRDVPAVAATVVLPNDIKVAVSSCHLSPFGEGAYDRQVESEEIMQAMSKESSNCILMGDFNMRQAEDKTVENLCGGGWIDAWKAGGSNKQLKFTWDSIKNPYYKNGFGFTARFDRCYAKGDDLRVMDFNLVGNQSVSENEGDCLSDHYGIAAMIEVTSSVGGGETMTAGLKKRRGDDGVKKRRSIKPIVRATNNNDVTESVDVKVNGNCNKLTGSKARQWNDGFDDDSDSSDGKHVTSKDSLSLKGSSKKATPIKYTISQHSNWTDSDSNNEDVLTKIKRRVREKHGASGASTAASNLDKSTKKKPLHHVTETTTPKSLTNTKKKRARFLTNDSSSSADDMEEVMRKIEERNAGQQTVKSKDEVLMEKIEVLSECKNDKQRARYSSDDDSDSDHDMTQAKVLARQKANISKYKRNPMAAAKREENTWKGRLSSRIKFDEVDLWDDSD